MRSILRWRSLGVAACLALGAVGLAACVADPPPVIGTAVAGNARATVTWSPPITNPTVLAYIVTPHIGATSLPGVRFESAATTGTVFGLTNGISYIFTVEAVNALGHESAASSQSNAVTPTELSHFAIGSPSCAARPR